VRCRLIELVNIHLFHDESNLKATEESPSSYSVFRKNALDFVVNKLSDGEDKCESGIFFIFGDLNFRLNLKELIQNILPNSQPQQTRSAENQVIKSTYRDDADANTDGEVVMTLEKKCFDVKKSIIQKDEKFMHLKKFDCEMQDQEKSLKEFPVAFPPSYPYSEDPEAPEPYMKTRCPAWCDRVLLSHQAWQLLREQKSEEDVEYGRIGDAVCMGDHKPIFLLFSVNDEWTVAGGDVSTIERRCCNDDDDQIAMSQVDSCCWCNYAHKLMLMTRAFDRTHQQLIH